MFLLTLLQARVACRPGQPFACVAFSHANQVTIITTRGQGNCHGNKRGNEKKKKKKKKVRFLSLST